MSRAWSHLMGPYDGDEHRAWTVVGIGEDWRVAWSWERPWGEPECWVADVQTWDPALHRWVVPPGGRVERFDDPPQGAELAVWSAQLVVKALRAQRALARARLGVRASVRTRVLVCLSGGRS